jgi:hypothetical protein
MEEKIFHRKKLNIGQSTYGTAIQMQNMHETILQTPVPLYEISVALPDPENHHVFFDKQKPQISSFIPPFPIQHSSTQYLVRPQAMQVCLSVLLQNLPLRPNSQDLK